MRRHAFAVRLLASLALVIFGAVPIAFGGVAAGAASPSPTNSGTASAAGGLTFTVGTLTNLKTVNPIQALNGIEYEFLNLNYDLALRFSPKTLAPYPGIVTSWSHSADGLTWTYKVRNGVKWQDGQPLTADDIAFTYDFMVKNNISAFSNYFPFTDSVTAPDPNTVVWKTKKPTLAPQFPPWVYILPQHIWGDMSAKQAKAYEKVPVIGSGPFQLVEWQKGQFWKFKAFKDYWAGAPHIDTLVFKKYDNAEAMVAGLKAGEIDFAENVPSNLYNTLANQAGITQNAAAATTFDQMSFNMVPNGEQSPTCGDCGKSTAHPALQDLTLRTAIEHAIDKQTLVEKVLNGHGVVGTTIVPTGFPEYHWNPPADELIDFNIDEANQMLDEAGYKRGSDGIRIDPKSGQPLKFRFYVLTSEPNEIKGAQFVKGWLKQIGIEINPQTITEGKLVSDWYANDYDLYMWGWGPDPDPDFILSTFTTDQCESWSDTCFSNKAYDQLYEQQHATVDVTARKQVIDKMQEFIYKQVPEVVLYYGEDLQAYRSNWTGFVDQPFPQGFKLFAYGNYSYLSLRPASKQSPASSGISGIVWVLVALAILALILIPVLLRRRGAEDRE